jgi:hypothetical protein
MQARYDVLYKVIRNSKIVPRNLLDIARASRKVCPAAARKRACCDLLTAKDTFSTDSNELLAGKSLCKTKLSLKRIRERYFATKPHFQLLRSFSLQIRVGSFLLNEQIDRRA